MLALDTVPSVYTFLWFCDMDPMNYIKTNTPPPQFLSVLSTKVLPVSDDSTSVDHSSFLIICVLFGCLGSTGLLVVTVRVL